MIINHPAKTAIVEFVERVTDENGSDYVPPAQWNANRDEPGARNWSTMESAE